MIISSSGDSSPLVVLRSVPEASKCRLIFYSNLCRLSKLNLSLTSGLNMNSEMIEFIFKCLYALFFFNTSEGIIFQNAVQYNWIYHCFIYIWLPFLLEIMTSALQMLQYQCFVMILYCNLTMH